MSILGIEKIIYGVSNVGECARYLTDWGFHSIDSHDPQGKIFATQEKHKLFCAKAMTKSYPHCITRVLSLVVHAGVK